MGPHWRRIAWGAAAALAATVITGCVELLPKSHGGTQESWQNFEDAKAAVDKIVPYQTRRAELSQQSIDPYLNPAVTLLSFSDVVQRFAGAMVKPEELDRGIRECLSAGKACTGYSIVVKRNYRDRIGSFWLDTFSFRREVDMTGWSFNGLVLFIDDVVVYTLYGGQPRIHEHEVNRNPLGPLQGWGDVVGPALISP